MSLRDGYRYEQNLTVQLSEHPDAKEATAAFLEKRKPVFRDGRRQPIADPRHRPQAGLTP